MLFTSRGRNKLSTAFVLALAVCLFFFAIYLKAAPNISSETAGHSNSQVKFWVKTTVQNTKVKLATVSAFDFIPPEMLGLIQHSGTFKQPVPASTLSLKDAFAETTYWFRPPPLS